MWGDVCVHETSADPFPAEILNEPQVPHALTPSGSVEPASPTQVMLEQQIPLSLLTSLKGQEGAVPRLSQAVSFLIFVNIPVMEMLPLGWATPLGL